MREQKVNLRAAVEPVPLEEVGAAAALSAEDEAVLASAPLDPEPAHSESAAEELARAELEPDPRVRVASAPDRIAAGEASLLSTGSLAGDSAPGAPGAAAGLGDPGNPGASDYAGPPVEMLALDIDGTLLRTDKRMSKRVLRAVHQARDKGVRVILATARPPRSVREIYQYMGLDTPQINYNGALIHDPVRKRHIHHQPLAGDLAMKVVRLARRLHPQTVVSVEILDRWYTDHVDESLPTETSRAFAPDFVGPLEAFLHVPVTKLMLLAKAEVMVEIRAAVEQAFQGRIMLAVSDAHLLQVIHPEADKAIALARVAGQYGIKAERVMAVGDAPNDVGMLRWAGLGVAMGNAWPAVQDAADTIVPSNDEDGVAQAIERFILARR